MSKAWILRTKQNLEEKIGTASKTELSNEFSDLANQCDKIKQWTERLSAQAYICVQPNPGDRLEDTVRFKFDNIAAKEDAEARRKTRTAERPTIYGKLGNYLIELGNIFGENSSTGSALISTGHAECELGKAHSNLLMDVYNSVIKPLETFIAIDVKKIQDACQTVEHCRLDYDAMKTREKRARAKEETQADAYKAEALKLKQEFDQQAQWTSKMMNDCANDINGTHISAVKAMVSAQVVYHQKCISILETVDLQKAGCISPAPL